METPDRNQSVKAAIACGLADEAQRYFLSAMEDCTARCGSPIETLMAAGLLFAMQSRDYFGGTYPVLMIADRLPEGCFTGWVPQCPGIVIYQQAPIGQYRADFLAVVATHAGYVFGAIECDGHAHHDLTKEQASRDRERDRFFQSLGVTVLRFPGSEIWASPMATAAGALLILEKLANGPTALRWAP